MEVDSSSPISTPPEASPPPFERPYSATQLAANNAPTANVSSTIFAKAADATAAVKKPRRKKEPENGEVKKPRKTREPRDPSKPARKKVKTNGDVSSSSSEPRPLVAAAPLYSTSTNGAPAAVNPQLAQPEAVRAVTNITSQPLRPSSSGQRYDPIRSASAENALGRHPYGSPPRPAAAPSPPHNARASPSIASLIGPSDSSLAYNTSPSKQPTSHPSSLPPSDSRLPAAAGKPALPPTSSSVAVVQTPPSTSTDGSDKPAAASKLIKSESAANAPSPKPPRQKDSLPAPSAFGLLSNSAMGRPDAGPKEYAEVPNQCIVIEVPMNKEHGNYINFIKEVENKYGFDVAHPRLAEHRRRMKEIAAAGAALESGQASGDEMPVDESDGSSDVDMKGPEDDSTAAETKVDGRKRRKRANDYDKNDDFIDDTELRWEEQALAVKEGFFVWSGPLIPEGDKPAVEKADGTVSRRGGRGRGSRGGGGATRGTGEPSTRGGARATGRGSRGGATARKPRITKADRARLETEKQERERMAMTAMKPSQYPGIAI